MLHAQLPDRVALGISLPPSALVMQAALDLRPTHHEDAEGTAVLQHDIPVVASPFA